MRRSNFTAVSWGSHPPVRKPKLSTWRGFEAPSDGTSAAGMSKGGFRWFQPWAFKFPSWGPQKHGEETTCPWYSTSRFLTLKIHEHNTWWFNSAEFGGDLLCSHSNWENSVCQISPPRRYYFPLVSNKVTTSPLFIGKYLWEDVNILLLIKLSLLSNSFLHPLMIF